MLDCNVWRSAYVLLPRVVHATHVQRHDIYVNGRDWHYLCGVIVTENLDSKDRQGGSSSAKGGFELKYLDIRLCATYPEEN